MRRTLFILYIALAASLATLGTAVAETLRLSVDEAAIRINEQTGAATLEIELSAESAAAFEDLTLRHTFSELALSLDGNVLVSARIQQPVSGRSMQIMADFSEPEIRAVVNRLNSGAHIEARVVED